MKLWMKIFLLWLGLLLAYLAGMTFFDHGATMLSAQINRIMQLALLLIAIFIFLREPNRKNKFIFLNFVLYFFFSVPALLYDFVGVSFLVSKYTRFLYFQYLSIAYTTGLAFAVVYLVIDLMFHEYKVFQKYIASIQIVGSFVVYLFLPFFQNPHYLETTEEIKQWIVLRSYVDNNHGEHGVADLANKVTLQAWKDGHAVADLYPAENFRRISELIPYIEGNNYKILEFQPLYMKTIFMDVLILFFILTFFGYQYRKDPPQGAYIDKIMFLVLLFVSMDILHNWGFIKSVEWGSFSELFTVGQYITVLAELLMVLFFGLRLRFIDSVPGQYYESELAVNPSGISRWRDWVDNAVLSQFFNLKLFNGRFFESRTGE
jgi:hypothetical protein